MLKRCLFRQFGCAFISQQLHTKQLYFNNTLLHSGFFFVCNIRYISVNQPGVLLLQKNTKNSNRKDEPIIHQS